MGEPGDHPVGTTGSGWGIWPYLAGNRASWVTLAGGMAMSSADGDKAVTEMALAQAKAQFAAAQAEQAQLQLLEPLSAEEIHDARERLGHGAGTVTVMRDAREARKGRGGRKPGSRNRRTEDFSRYIRQFGRDPAVTLMEIQATPPEELVARSELLDPAKRRMSYADAQSLRVRCAEALMPYIHAKKPVAVDLSVEGDFNLLIPGVNIDPADARRAAEGTFVLDGAFLEVDQDGEALP